jgi:hypothetical protein
MTRSSKLSIRGIGASHYQTKSRIGRLIQAYRLSLLEESVPSELRNLIGHLLAIEARKSHSTARAIEVLQVAAAPVGSNSNRTDGQS